MPLKFSKHDNARDITDEFRRAWATLDAVRGELDQRTRTTNVQVATLESHMAVMVGVTDGDKGDIIVSGGGTSWAFDPTVVTAAALTVLDDPSVAAMVDTLGGAAATGTGGLVRATSPTLLTPTIADFTNAQHDHLDADDGGTLSAAAIASGLLANARIATGTPDGSKFLRDDQVWTTIPTPPPGYTDEEAQDAVGAMVDTSLTYVDGTPLLQRAALTGDVTAPAGSNATTIANDAVTLAKMANVATDRLIGRDTAGTGDPEALTVGGGIEFTGSGGIQSSAFTGDVTKGAGGTAQTIANDAVTYAKMQNVSATDKVLGRSTAGAGDVEEIACTAAGRALIDDATAADMLNTLGAAAKYTHPPIMPFSCEPDTSGQVFENRHIKTSVPFRGIGVVGSATLSADRIAYLLFRLPQTLPAGTCKLVIHSIGVIAGSHDYKFEPKWCNIAANEALDKTRVTEGVTTKSVTTSEADDIVETKITLDVQAPNAGAILAINMTFVDSGWTVTVTSTHQCFLIWE